MRPTILHFLLLTTYLMGCQTSDTSDANEQDDLFYWIALSDTHIIDDQYQGPEGSPLDSESIYLANERLGLTIDMINKISIPIDFVTLSGDVIHEYPSADYDYYFNPSNQPAVDIAATLLSGFEVPYYVGLGNHDYDLGKFSREMTHQLFQEKMGIEPYYYWDHKGFRFIMLNSQLGPTWDTSSPLYDTNFGSLGQEQLIWLDNLLSEGVPSFILLHHHQLSMTQEETTEGELTGFAAVLDRHPASVAQVFTGHLHRWMDLGREIILGATRFDEDAFFVIECNTTTQTFSIVNYDDAHWMGEHPDAGFGGMDPWNESEQSPSP